MPSNNFLSCLVLNMTLMLPSFAYASDINDVTKNLVCKENILKILKKPSITYQWRKIIKTSEYEIFRSPLGKVGHWIEFRNGGTPELQQVTARKTLRTTWKKNDCAEVTENLGPVKAFSNSIYRNSFTDFQLAKLLSQKKNYFLYLWSPGMVYSGKAHNQFKRVAKEMGYNFISLVDENFPKDIVKDSAKLYDITDQYQGFHSFDLLMREAGLHYPVSFLIENGRISRFPLIGVYSPEYLSQRIKIERRSLANETSR